MRKLIALALALAASTVNAGAILAGGSAGDASPSQVTATGSITGRTIAARAADVTNVKDGYSNVRGAKCDMQQYRTTWTTTAGSPTLSASTATFTQSMVGMSIVLPGAGAAGAALITQIQSVQSSTSATMAANASTAIATLTYVPIGTDDSAAIQAAVVGAYAKVLNRNSGPVITASLEFPQGTCLILSTINWTNYKSIGIQINGDGAVLYGATNGTPIIDALGSRWLRWSNLSFYGDQYAPPNVGLQIGRINTTAIDSSDNHELENLWMGGYYTRAGFYNLSAEQSSFKHFHVFNNYSNANAYAAIFDGVNHWGLTSAFQTIAQPVDTPQSFNSNTCMDCIFYGAGQSPLWIAGAASMRFIGSYSVNTSTLGAYYCATLYFVTGSAMNDFNADLHCEPNTLTDAFYIDADPAVTTVYFQNFAFADPIPLVSNSLIKRNASITSLQFGNSNFNIGQYTASKYFDNLTGLTVSGGTMSVAQGSTVLTSALRPSAWRTTYCIGATCRLPELIGGATNSGITYDIGQTVGGQNNSCNAGQACTVFGNSNNMLGTYSIAIGGNGGTDRSNSNTIVFGGGNFTTLGDSQYRYQLLRRAVAATSTTRLFVNNGSTATAANNLVIPTNAVYKTTVSAVCRDATGGADYAAWKPRYGVLSRGAGNAAYAGDASTNSTADYSAGAGSTASLIIGADTTNQQISVSVTMPNTNSWHCTADVSTLEVQ